jgi:hypothetical protein
LQPVECRESRRHPEEIFAEARDGSIVKNLSVVIAPRGVKDLTDTTFGSIARDHAIHQRNSVSTANEIFVKWRNIEKAGAQANRIVLVDVIQLVRLSGQVSCPLDPILTVAQRIGARMKGGMSRHRFSSKGASGFRQPERIGRRSSSSLPDRRVRIVPNNE